MIRVVRVFVISGLSRVVGAAMVNVNLQNRGGLESVLHIGC